MWELLWTSGICLGCQGEPSGAWSWAQLLKNPVAGPRRAGLFYCPLLPLVGCVKLVVTFYVKRVSVMCTQPSVRPWRAVHAQTVFLALAFLSFGLATATLGYALLQCVSSAAVAAPRGGGRARWGPARHCRCGAERDLEDTKPLLVTKRGRSIEPR